MPKKLVIWFGLAVILLALVLALSDWITLVKIDGTSMEPGIKNGSTWIVSEEFYRLVEPQRGDVIWFEDPQRVYEPGIGRIVGLPGEKISIKEGYVYIDGVKLNEVYLDKPVFTSVPAQSEWEKYSDQKDRPFLLAGEEKVIPQNNFYILADKRYFGRDSRIYGPIIRQLINGKFLFRVW